MREQAVRKFMWELGCDQIDENGSWLNAKCPLASWTHAGGVDSHPSFGITISDEGRSVWYCFGCSPEPRPIAWLLHSTFVMTRRYPFDAARIYRDHENHWGNTQAVEIPDGWKSNAEAEKPETVPYQLLRLVPMLQGKEDFEARRCRFWMEHERHIPVWTQNLCRLRYLSDHSAVVFPITDIRGDVYQLKARSRKEKKMFAVKPEHFELQALANPGTPKKIGIWFGMFLIDWSMPVMLVEGELDAMRLMSLGFFNSIASASSSVTDAQIDALHTNTYFLGYDDDKAGRHAHARIIDRIGDQATMFELKWGIVNREDGEPCKDAGDLMNSDDLNTVMTNRKLVQI